MAGHSKFKTIQHRKGAQDIKRAKIFTKILAEITSAVKIGGEANNPRLKTVLEKARAANVPKDKIDKAMENAKSDSNSDEFSLAICESFISGCAFVIVLNTNNKLTALPSIRSILKKSNNVVASPGTCAFLFDKVGIISYEALSGSEEELLDLIDQCNILDFAKQGGGYQFFTNYQDLHNAVDSLSELLGEPESFLIGYKPKILKNIEDQDKLSLIRNIYDKISALDDVRDIYLDCLI